MTVELGSIHLLPILYPTVLILVLYLRIEWTYSMCHVRKYTMAELKINSCFINFPVQDLFPKNNVTESTVFIKHHLGHLQHHVSHLHAKWGLLLQLLWIPVLHTQNISMPLFPKVNFSVQKNDLLFRLNSLFNLNYFS